MTKNCMFHPPSTGEPRKFVRAPVQPCSMRCGAASPGRSKEGLRVEGGLAERAASR